MTLVKIVPTWTRTARNLDLASLLLRDGALYFAIAFTSSAVLFIMTFALSNRPGIELAALPFCIVLSPIAACRLFISLKAFGQADRIITGTSTEMTVQSTLAEFSLSESSAIELPVTPVTDPVNPNFGPGPGKSIGIESAGFHRSEGEA